jgi:hypothetical protein
MQFYVMDLKVGSPYETWLDEMEPIHRGTADDCQKCPQCGESMGSMLPWLPPYRATIRAYGKQLGDVAFDGMNIVVSEKFRLVWTESQLRGIDVFHPLERIRVRPARLGRKTPTYYFVRVQRFGARVDLKRSLIEYDRPFTCTYCLEAGIDTVRGFTIDLASWTGEDLFIAWGKPGSIIVTDRVRQLRDDHDLKNMTLTPVEEFVWDPLNQWTPVDYSNELRDKYEYEYVTEEDPPTN